MREIIADYDWKAFTVIYETPDSLIRLHDVLQLHNPEDSPVKVFQLGSDNDYKPLLKRIANNRESRIIIDASPEKVTDLIKQGIDMKMMEEYQVSHI